MAWVVVSRLNPCSLASLSEPFVFFSAVANVLPTFAWVLLGLIGMSVFYFSFRKHPVYLIDFGVFRGTKEQRISSEDTMKMREMWLTKCGLANDEESRTFIKKIMGENGTLGSSGVGYYTYCPEATKRMETSMEQARAESENAMFSALDDLFKRCNFDPLKVDILIVNCSLFNPTPSLTSMIIRHYKMKTSVITYNLAGMGCSAGLISVDLAKDLLQVHKGRYAVVVSTENITQNWYMGSEKAMMLPNALFRMGAAALLLSNHYTDRFRAKYQLNTVVRIHKAADEKAYQSVYQCEDEKGWRGVRLSKDLMEVAADALKLNISCLAPQILPLSEMIAFAVNTLRRKVLHHAVKPYMPNFTKAAKHFCIHAGGRAVIDALEKSLNLTSFHTEPSRATLYRWGNTSSSSIWYEMLFLESHNRVKSGDRIWQITFGSGFKCNSAVWTALRTQHRSLDDWTCGFPEVEEDFNKYLKDLLARQAARNAQAHKAASAATAQTDLSRTTSEISKSSDFSRTNSVVISRAESVKVCCP